MLTMAVIALAGAPDAATDRIAAALTDAARAWSAGDRAALAQLYAPDAMLAQGEVTRGRDAIAARLREERGAGALSFQPVAWRVLSAVHVLHVVRWTLTPAGGAARSGLATMLFERRREGWRIIAEHDGPG